MFEDLASFRVIVVTGPHRSGTTICGEMIASDTGRRSIREELFGWGIESQFRHWMQGRTQTKEGRTITKADEARVLQAPFFAHAAHFFNQWVEPDRLCVVFMMRDPEEIRVSQRKLDEYLADMTGKPGGVALYRLRNYHAQIQDPSLVYENWREQKAFVKHWREVEYKSLAAHPMWIDDRTQFHFRQTR